MTWGGPDLPTGLDQFTAKQKPNVTPIDALSQFVMDQIRAAETEPRVDMVPKFYNREMGAMAHRYAGHVRADMVAFRRIVALYVEAPDVAELRQVVAAIAMRWETHPDFRSEWRLS